MPLPAPLPPGLREVALGDDGLTGWAIETQHCTALVSAQGAQLLEFRPRDGAPVLWCSPAALLRPGKAIRGGIPICFPWFGPHPDDPALPSHGFARTRTWQLEGAEAEGELLRMRLSLESDASSRDLWPHDFRAELHLLLGKLPALELRIRNTGLQPFRFTFAFHSYFPVTDSRRARVDGLEGTVRIDQLDPQRRRARQHGPLRFAGETDLVFLGVGGELRLVDESAGTTLRIRPLGCRSVVAWNPGPDKAARLGDLPAGAWSGMACVETGNVEDDAVELAPGASARLGLALSR